MNACWLFIFSCQIRLLSIVPWPVATLHLVFVPLSAVPFYSLLFLQAVPACFKLLILFPATKCSHKKKTKQSWERKTIPPDDRFQWWNNDHQKSCFKFQIYLSMFFVHASLLLLPPAVSFDGSEQYFWICSGSCPAFYLDDFISDFTEQRAYAIWNGIAFLARSNIFCHSSKSFYSDSRKHYFMPLEHISVLIYQAGQGTMPAHSWNQRSNYLAIQLHHRHRQIRKGGLAICSG